MKTTPERFDAYIESLVPNNHYIIGHNDDFKYPYFISSIATFHSYHFARRHVNT